MSSELKEYYENAVKLHDYEGTNWNIIADVVFEEIPILIKELEKFSEKEVQK